MTTVRRSMYQIPAAVITTVRHRNLDDCLRAVKADTDGGAGD